MSVRLQNNLTQKLGQRLALTPQLTQSLKLLAMNSLDLETYLDACLESNPLLESEGKEDFDERSFEDMVEDEWREEGGDERWESMYSASMREGLPDPDQQWKDEQTLGESLHEQVNQQPMTDHDREVAHVIIDSLDDDGYFRVPVAQMANETGVSVAQVTHVLESVVQQLEPAGIGARDLLECLMLQLPELDDATRLVRRLLLQFSEYLIEHDEDLAARVGCSVAEIAQVRARIRRLDPFPGHGLHGLNNIYIKPEIIFKQNRDRTIEVEVPQSGWKGLKMNDAYAKQKWSGDDRTFMDAAKQEAKWLLSALEQRSDTLMRVGLCLAARQKSFLEHGILGLKPLTLQDVAQEVGLHESTISRVTNGKYAQTPLGLIEMRCFFSAGLPTRGGGTISVFRVQQRIQALIQGESSAKPIADQAIAERLQAEGIEIARRTVAKYREQLGIASSSQRKRVVKT
ncbi:MAG: RNA polymerase factor sigma-54 [Zetaproteobacteria bacterium]|nr:RNA polymerase factor sigma-54 [Zetaproteobacteria bacterium]